MRQNSAVAARWADGPAQRLDNLLRAARLRDVDLAKALAVDPSTISKYRSGERIPRADILAEMIERARGRSGRHASSGLNRPNLPPHEPGTAREADQGLQQGMGSRVQGDRAQGGTQGRRRDALRPPPERRSEERRVG